MSSATTDEDEKFDQQVFYLSGLALVAIIIVGIVYFVATTGLSATIGLIQGGVVSGITQIRLLIPVGIAKLNASVNTLKSVGSAALNEVISTVTDGRIKVTNAVVSVGESFLNILEQGFQSILNTLGEIGTFVLEYFQTLMSPLQNIIRVVGVILEDILLVYKSQFDILLGVILQLANAIVAINNL